MKKIIILVPLVLFLSCSSLPFFNNDSSNNDSTLGEKYIELQVQVHTAYTLLKALNKGAISQEEYDSLKKELFN